MKRTALVALVAVAALSLAACSPKAPEYATRAEKIVAEIHNPSSKYVVVASHRGDWRNFPENSIPAIESVIKMGVDIMELDLKMTKDSVLVLSHDRTIDRCTNGKGKVSDFTLDSLKTFRLRRAHNVTTDSLHMPTLEEALKVCKDRIVVNVDQGFEYYDQVLEITEKLGVTDQILIKGKKPARFCQELFSKNEHNMMYMPIIDILKPQGQALFQEYQDEKIVPLAYEVCFDKITPEVEACFKTVKETSSKLWINSIWGSLCGNLDDDNAYINGTQVYDKLLSYGPTMIQTDRPEFLINYLRSKGLHD